MNEEHGMYALRKGKPLNRLIPLLFGTALAWGALFFPACETGFDADRSLPLAGLRSFQITANDGALLLQWTKIAPAQGIIPDYRVYYGTKTDPNTAEQLPGDILSNASNLVQARIAGLANHTPYYVWVKAIYVGLGESDFSAMESGMPIPPPPTPGPLTVIAGEEMLQATWEPVEDAFTYEVYYQASGSGDAPPAEAAMATVSETGAALLGLTDGTSYTLWVRAVNTAGVSPGYAKGSGIPQAADSAPATAPKILEVMPGDKKLTLTWEPVEGVPNYRLSWGTTDDFSTATAVPALVPANAPQVRADIAGLANDRTYYVWVQSWNSRGASGPSPSASGTPLAKTPIDFSNLQFELGQAAAEYIFAQDLPESVFFPEGRPNTDRLTRVQETTLGNLFTDGAAWYVRKECPDENIDFVFLNGGYIDNVLPKGTITVGSFSGVVQPDSRKDTLMLLTMTGTDLKKFFNDVEGKAEMAEPGDVSGVAHTGRGGPHNTGFFGVVSKEARYILKYYKPPEGTVEPPGWDSEPYLHGFIDTEKDLLINGALIDDAREYRICVTDYLASGEYFVRLKTAGKNPRIIDTPFWHGVAAYIYDQGTITPYLDGRIKVEGGVPLPPPWTPGDLIKP
jgi:hypothetical protein